MPLAEQELIIFLKHPVFSVIRVDQSLVFCVVFVNHVFLSFLFFCHCIVFPRITSDYHFGIFNLSL
jgi:hypothetical protein